MGKWPNKGDLPVDRARQVCSEYRRALELVDPATCQIIDTAAIAAGEAWVAPRLAINDEDDLVSVPDAADIVGRSARWVYGWISEDHSRARSNDPLRVRVGDVIDAVAYERDWRARREA